jgi:hypothetical protein
MNQDPTKRKLAVILSADVVDYKQLIIDKVIFHERS